MTAEPVLSRRPAETDGVRDGRASVWAADLLITPAAVDDADLGLALPFDFVPIRPGRSWLRLRNRHSHIGVGIWVGVGPGVDKITTVVPAPLMSTIAELCAFLALETSAAPPGAAVAPPVAPAVRPAAVANGASPAGRAA